MTMQTERRLEPKRIEVSKPVELLQPDGVTLAAGTAVNMSDAGIGVSFDQLPEMGPDVRLRVFWRDDREPIEQQASVVWHDIVGNDGATVGFKLVDSAVAGEAKRPEAPKKERFSLFKKRKAPVAESSATEPEAVAPQPPVLAHGAEVWLQKGGVAIRAEVASVGDILDDNSVELVVKITDPAFCDPGAVTGHDPLDDEDFTAHPFRDAWHAAKKYLGPAARYAAIGAVFTAAFAKRAFHFTKAFIAEKRQKRLPQ